MMERSSHFFDLWSRYKITAALTTPYHSQGSSITERMHCTMKSVLACLCQQYLFRWLKLLLQCQSKLNTAVLMTTGISPYFTFFSQPPPYLISHDIPNIEASEDGICEDLEIIKDTSENGSQV